MGNTVKLQGIYGQKQGIPAKNLKIGDVIIWNFGYKSEVVEITPSKTGKTITFMLKSLESGNINPRRMGSDSLVVLEEKKQKEPKKEVENKTKEYVFDELGYFTENQCWAIKKELQGFSFMNFDIAWSNCAGNCTLILRTDYEKDPQEIKNFFLHCALGKIFDLKRKGL